MPRNGIFRFHFASTVYYRLWLTDAVFGEWSWNYPHCCWKRRAKRNGLRLTEGFWHALQEPPCWCTCIIKIPTTCRRFTGSRYMKSPVVCQPGGWLWRAMVVNSHRLFPEYSGRRFHLVSIVDQTAAPCLQVEYHLRYLKDSNRTPEQS